MIFPQAARDRFRRDLSNVIAVVRLPTGAESTWVALIRKDAADTSGLARFNRAAPYFLTWVLGKTRKDHRALLASQPASRAIIRSVIEGPLRCARGRHSIHSSAYCGVVWRRSRSSNVTFGSNSIGRARRECSVIEQRPAGRGPRSGDNGSAATTISSSK